ncbi:GNAT family N-acetyltransferase [Vibrio methylphosphonaticus]|uniref:GNAT family N-acetyltransferase n=1 Tax=Vibrio methylphosphonaticus TaxID=2946866 RepID=UPI00202A6DA1|nr:GNAT family protein [Vibrio methylphosphonaticus]MCL9777169.1 GNAT family N-acetyltransferase [Vibrio methylphosphonaticus]
MFVMEVEDDLALALVEPKFAPLYLEIVVRERDYLSQWLAWPELAHDEAFFLAFIQRSLQGYAEGKSMTCAMVWQDNVVGNISFNTINTRLKKVEIGYWLSAKYQGNGIVTKSVAKLIEIAFLELAMEKVEISAAVENGASRGVAERLGFAHEGTITRSENLNGRIIDHAIYGLSRTAWRVNRD